MYIKRLHGLSNSASSLIFAGGSKVKNRSHQQILRANSQITANNSGIHYHQPLIGINRADTVSSGNLGCYLVSAVLARQHGGPSGSRRIGSVILYYHLYHLYFDFILSPFILFLIYFLT